MVRIRMTKRLAAGRKVRCLKHQPSEEETGNNRGWQRIKRRVRWRRKHAADEEASEGASINSDAAVAMKVTGLLFVYGLAEAGWINLSFMHLMP